MYLWFVVRLWERSSAETNVDAWLTIAAAAARISSTFSPVSVLRWFGKTEVRPKITMVLYSAQAFFFGGGSSAKEGKWWERRREGREEGR